MKACIFILFLLFNLQSGFAQDAAKRQLIESLASELKDDLVFYRWQSETSGQALLAEKEYTQKLHDYFMNMRIDGNHFQAGHGVYVAENPYSSSNFVRGKGRGSLIEVRVKKGSKYLDLTDRDTRKKLSELKISFEEIYKLNPQIAIKYSDSHGWWVLKGREGIEFRKFTGRGLKTEYLIKILPNILGGEAERIYVGELKAILIERLRIGEITHDNSLLMQVFSKAELDEFRDKDLQELIVKINSRKELLKILDDPEGRAGLMRLVADDRSYKLFPILQKHLSVTELFKMMEQLPLEQQKAIIQGVAQSYPSQSYRELLTFYAKKTEGNPGLKLDLGPFPEGKHPNLQTKTALAQVNLTADEALELVEEMASKERLKQLESYGWKINDRAIVDRASIAYKWSLSYRIERLVELNKQSWKDPSEDIVPIIRSIRNKEQLAELINVMNDITRVPVVTDEIGKPLAKRIQELVINKGEWVSLLNRIKRENGWQANLLSSVARNLYTFNGAKDYIDFIATLPPKTIDMGFIEYTFKQLNLPDMSVDDKKKIMALIEKNHRTASAFAHEKLLLSEASTDKFIKFYEVHGLPCHSFLDQLCSQKYFTHFIGLKPTAAELLKMHHYIEGNDGIAKMSYEYLKGLHGFGPSSIGKNQLQLLSFMALKAKENEKVVFQYFRRWVAEENTINARMAAFLRDFEKIYPVGDEYFEALADVLSKASSRTHYIDLMPDLEDIGKIGKPKFGKYPKFAVDQAEKLQAVFAKTKDKFFVQTAPEAKDLINLHKKLFTIVRYNRLLYYSNQSEILKLFQSPGDFVNYAAHLNTMLEVNPQATDPRDIKHFRKQLVLSLDHFESLNPNYEDYQKLEKRFSLSNRDFFQKVLIDRANTLLKKSKTPEEFKNALQRVSQMLPRGADGQFGSEALKVLSYADVRGQTLGISVDGIDEIKRGLAGEAVTFPATQCVGGLKAGLLALKRSMRLK